MLRDICSREQEAHCFETNTLWQERTKALDHYFYLRNGQVAWQLHVLIIRKPSSKWTFIHNPCVHISIWGLGFPPRLGQTPVSILSLHLERSSPEHERQSTRPRRFGLHLESVYLVYIHPPHIKTSGKKYKFPVHLEVSPEKNINVYFPFIIILFDIGNRPQNMFTFPFANIFSVLDPFVD